ncbi:hypothetical protein ACFXGA_33775 [Actinosynnema sp. NPDC059335]|uniref:hypothetical protein n=1 Tax=Actinosynnema sp. NPDC059335 TaxID=3346804 RepID=UPI00366EDB23
MSDVDYTARHKAMLKAIGEGRGRLVGGTHPNLTIDGLWCDFTATNDLVDHGLVRSVSHAASLTPSGHVVLALLTA